MEVVGIKCEEGKIFLLRVLKLSLFKFVACITNFMFVFDYSYRKTRKKSKLRNRNYLHTKKTKLLNKMYSGRINLKSFHNFKTMFLNPSNEIS